MNELKLSAEELYFLGRMVGAKYIDYTYIQMMDDIEDNYDLHEKEALAGLGKRGILEEDFSGNMELAFDVKDMLDPIFFGGKESMIDVLELGDGNKRETHRFHFNDSSITEVTLGVDVTETVPAEEDAVPVTEERTVLLLKSVGASDIDTIVENAVPATQGKSDVTEIDSNKVDLIISAKNIQDNGTSDVRVYLGQEGVMFASSESGEAVAIAGEELASQIKGILKGGNVWAC